jgi:hypothetical protein
MTTRMTGQRLTAFIAEGGDTGAVRAAEVPVGET